MRKTSSGSARLDSVSAAGLRRVAERASVAASGSSVFGRSRIGAGYSAASSVYARTKSAHAVRKALLVCVLRRGGVCSVRDRGVGTEARAC